MENRIKNIYVKRGITMYLNIFFKIESASHVVVIICDYFEKLYAVLRRLSFEQRKLGIYSKETVEIIETLHKD